MLLSVLPVTATIRLSGGKTWFEGALVPWSLVALAVSLMLTSIYHLGFPEFRGPAMASPLIGNGIMTFSHLATRSAVTPAIAHVALHIAAVVHGYSTALPAPPHY